MNARIVDNKLKSELKFNLGQVTNDPELLAWASAFETHSKYGVKGEFHQMNKNNAAAVKDLFELFSYLYKQKYGIDYEIPKTSFIGHEFHLLRVAIDENGAEQIVCATVNCIDTNDKTVSIPYFIAGLKYYLTQYNPYIYFAVKRFGNDDIKKLWRKFIYLDSIWFP